jgi:hypothetical protein
VGARIVSIVDAYEAMIAGRPYRAAISHEAAIVELRRQAGIQFDPELVQVFAEIFAAGVPWEPDVHVHVHDHVTDGEEDPVHLDAGDSGRDAADSAPIPLMHPAAIERGPLAIARTTAEMHDAVHERRRRAV